jgi:hypothetical protein
MIGQRRPTGSLVRPDPSDTGRWQAAQLVPSLRLSTWAASFLPRMLPAPPRTRAAPPAGCCTHRTGASSSHAYRHVPIHESIYGIQHGIARDNNCDSNRNHNNKHQRCNRNNDPTTPQLSRRRFFPLFLLSPCSRILPSEATEAGTAACPGEVGAAELRCEEQKSRVPQHPAPTME